MKLQHSLNAKIMEEKLKKGWVTSDFANYFQCTEEEFVEALKNTLSPRASKGYISRLKKNEKHPKATEKTQTLEETAVTQLSDNDNAYADITTKSDVESSASSSLEELRNKKAEIQESINELELAHKKLFSERVEIRNLISGFKKRLIELKEEINQCQTQVLNLSNSLNEKLENMHSLNTRISKEQALLEEINTQIEIMQKVSILVYSSGELEIDAPFAVEFSEDDCKVIFTSIIQNELAGSLTVNQIKGISRLMVSLNFFKSMDMKCEIAFESSLAEEFYNTLNS